MAINRKSSFREDSIGGLIRRCAERVIPAHLHGSLIWISGTDSDHGKRSWHYANLSYQGSRGAALDLAAPKTEQGRRPCRPPPGSCSSTAGSWSS